MLNLSSTQFIDYVVIGAPVVFSSFYRISLNLENGYVSDRRSILLNQSISTRTIWDSRIDLKYHHLVYGILVCVHLGSWALAVSLIFLVGFFLFRASDGFELFVILSLGLLIYGSQNIIITYFFIEILFYVIVLQIFTGSQSSTRDVSISCTYMLYYNFFTSLGLFLAIVLSSAGSTEEFLGTVISIGLTLKLGVGLWAVTNFIIYRAFSNSILFAYTAGNFLFILPALESYIVSAGLGTLLVSSAALAGYAVFASFTNRLSLFKMIALSSVLTGSSLLVSYLV